jgi:hypothetical protein
MPLDDPGAGPLLPEPGGGTAGGDPHWTILPGSVVGMALLGVACGLVMRRAARTGYLIPPEYVD